MDYTGYRELELNDEQLANFYSGLYEYPNDLNENEYVIIKNNGSIVDKVCYRQGMIRHIRYPVINDHYGNMIKARNEYQNLAIDLLLSRDVPVKLLSGRAGSGKDYLMSAAAMFLIDKGKFKKIVYIRPNITMDGIPDIGYRKGDTYQKLAWTLGPLVDKYGGKQSIQQLIKKEIIELVPLMEIRGRSFDNSIMYVSQGQNLTTKIVQSIITRVGENTQLWFNGDTAQIDRTLFEDDNGLRSLTNKLKGNALFGCVDLPIIERSPIAQLGALFE